jgi:hypothetical protein
MADPAGFADAWCLFALTQTRAGIGLRNVTFWLTMAHYGPQTIDTYQKRWRKKSGTVFLTDWLAGNNGEMPYRILETGK